MAGEKNKASGQPWERQPGESKQAYEAFKKYLELGDERSNARVGQELGKSKTLIDRWSSVNSWVKRVNAFDDYMSRKELKEHEKQFKEMIDRQLITAKKFQTVALTKLGKMDEKKIMGMRDRDVLEFFLKAADLERELRKESIKTNPVAAEETGQASLSDTILSAYKKRMEGMNDEV